MALVSTRIDIGSLIRGYILPPKCIAIFSVVAKSPTHSLIRSVPVSRLERSEAFRQVSAGGHMVFATTEAFTPEQLLEVYDTNVLSTQGVKRAALSQLRKQKKGLVLRVGSTSARGGTPPYLSPYFAAKALWMRLLSAARIRRIGRESAHFHGSSRNLRIFRV